MESWYYPGFDVFTICAKMAYSHLRFPRWRALILWEVLLLWNRESLGAGAFFAVVFCRGTM